MCAFETEFAATEGDGGEGEGGREGDKDGMGEGEGVRKDEGYVAGVRVVTGVSAKPGGLKVRIREVGGGL